jgi:hypothetical protein
MRRTNLTSSPSGFIPNETPDRNLGLPQSVAKPFQKRRSTRQTELAERFPQHVVCAWIGNSHAVAAKHYLQVTDEHFAAGAGLEAAQNLAQQASACLRNGSHGDSETAENPENLAICGVSEGYPVAEEGLEPPTRGL